MYLLFLFPWLWDKNIYVNLSSEEWGLPYNHSQTETVVFFPGKYGSLPFLSLPACLLAFVSLCLSACNSSTILNGFLWNLILGVLLSPWSLIINQHVSPSKSSYLAHLNAVDGSTVFSSKLTILENYAVPKDCSIEALYFLRLQYVL